MHNPGEHSDARLGAARYQVDKLRRELGEPEEPEQVQATPAQRAAYVQESIAQAIRRGDFDNLPGAGKPLPDLGRPYDPNWWIRRKIEREQLTGLGPPALTLRTEDAQLDERIATLSTERAVRELLEDFNSRVIEARRQLLGGPPVVTRTRDVDAELVRWREARAAERLAAEERAVRAAQEWASLGWRERRRRRRAERGGSAAERIDRSRADADRRS